MSYCQNMPENHRGEKGCGITAPYCPPPACPPVRPMPCMDSCPKPEKPRCPSPKPPVYKAVPWPRPVKPCPPAHQSGVVCQQVPVKPAKPKCESVLLQKIIGCEKRHIPQLCVRLELLGLHGCAPYRLMSVQASGAQPWWTQMDCHGPDARQHIRVSIPVCCQVCDSEGNMMTVTTVVEAEVSYKWPGQHGDGWRNSLFIVPCVRLVGGDVCSEDHCFCVQLEVGLELYLLRPETCAMHRPEPAYPELPLYPVPPHWHRDDRAYEQWPWK